VHLEGLIIVVIGYVDGKTLHELYGYERLPQRVYDEVERASRSYTPKILSLVIFVLQILWLQATTVLCSSISIGVGFTERRPTRFL